MATAPIPTSESYLVIGGGTSLGEPIVDQLLRRGATRVSIFDAQPLAAEQATKFRDSVNVYVGDILIPESIADAVKSVSATPTFILHDKSYTIRDPVLCHMHYPHGHGL